MGIGCNGGIGGLGAGAFAAIGVDIGLLLALHGITVQVTRHDTTAPSNIYGEPSDVPEPFEAKVLLGKQEMIEVDTIAGGKRNETLTLMGHPDTLRENDIIDYGGRLYDVRNVGRTVAGSAIAAEVYVAVSEVDV